MVSLPRTVVPERNCTCVIAAPVPGVAVADSGVTVFTPTLLGAVREMVGAAAETVTLTALEMTTTPAESVTRAVSTDVPMVAGDHENE